MQTEKLSRKGKMSYVLVRIGSAFIIWLFPESFPDDCHTPSGSSHFDCANSQLNMNFFFYMTHTKERQLATIGQR